MAITAKFEADFAQFVTEAEKATGSLSKIEGTSKDVGSALEDLKSGAESVAGALGLAFSIEAAVNFLSTITEEARSLQILSLQTQTSTDELQILGAATKEFGIDADQLGRGIYQLSRRIAGGDDSVVTGLALMGLKLSDVQNLHGEELFMTVERAAGKLQGTIRDTAEGDLFGGKLGASMGAFSVAAQENYDHAKEITTLIGGDALKAATDYANMVERTSKNLHAMAVEMLGPVLEGANKFMEVANKTGVWSAFWARLKDSTVLSSGAFDALAASVGLVGATGDKVMPKLKGDVELVSAATQAAADQTKMAADQAAFMAVLEANAAATLDASQIRNLEHLKEIGQLNARNAEGIGVNASQFAKYVAGIAAAKQATADLAKAEAEADAIEMTQYANRIKAMQEVTAARLKGYGFAGQIAALQSLDAAEQLYAQMVEQSLNSEKDRAKVREEAATRHLGLMNQEMVLEVKQAGVVNAAVLAELDAQVKLNAEYGRTATGAIAVTTAEDTLRLALEKLHLTKVDGIDQSAQEQVLMDAYTKQLYDEAVAQDHATDARKKGNDELAKTPALLQAASDAAMHTMGFVGTAIPADILASVKGMDSVSGGIEASRQMALRGLTSFDTGGPVLQDGPIYAHAGEYVLPKGGGGTTVVNNVFHLVDTESNLARRVSDTVLRSITAGKKLSA